MTENQSKGHRSGLVCQRRFGGQIHRAQGRKGPGESQTKSISGPWSEKVTGAMGRMRYESHLSRAGRRLKAALFTSQRALKSLETL